MPDIAANRIRAVMLQPEEPETTTLEIQQIAAGKADEASGSLIQRLGTELNLDVDGLRLTAKPGTRVLLGSSRGLSHILAPDSQSISFTSKAELTKRWILTITLSLNRDWTWNGLAQDGIEFLSNGTVLGKVVDPRSVNPNVLKVASHADALPDRTLTKLVFFHAIDPKPTPGHFPAELDITIDTRVNFRYTPSSDDANISLRVHVPIASQPIQTPKLVSAGIALSPYLRSKDYSSTDPRMRMLWLEFDHEVENPADSLFGRVLTYAPDSMLTDGLEVKPPREPPLPIDPEYIRVIRPGQSDDQAGLAAAQQLISTDSPQHFLLPIPPGIEPESTELFGFFTYEFRVGHLRGWSTAQARFGPALRVTGIQHPPPTFICEVSRTAEGILASAVYARAVFNNEDVTASPQPTEIWIMLYTQVVHVDGADNRNILLSKKKAGVRQPNSPSFYSSSPIHHYGLTGWTQEEIERLLANFGLPADRPLSVLSVELLPEFIRPSDPLGEDLGKVRILRTSSLVKVPEVCVSEPCK